MTLHAGTVERFVEDLREFTRSSSPPSVTYWLRESAELIVAMDAETKVVLTDLAYHITRGVALKAQRYNLLTVLEDLAADYERLCVDGLTKSNQPQVLRDARAVISAVDKDL